MANKSSLFWLFIGLFLLGLGLTPALAAGKIDDLLVQADKIRSADTAGFNNVLKELAAEEAQMSAEQASFFQFLKAYQLGIAGNYSKAEHLLSQIIQSNASLELRFRAAYTLANIQSLSRNFIPAFTHLNLALSWFEKIEQPELRLQVLIAAAYTYSESGLYKESQRFLQQAQPYATAPRDRCLLALLQRQNIFAMQQTDDFSLSAAVDSACSEANEQIALLLNKALDAQQLLAQQLYKDAFELLSTHLAAAEQSRYPRLISEFYLELARSSFHQQQFETASRYLNKITEMKQTLGASKVLVNAYELQTNIAEANKNFKDALYFNKLYQQADKVLFDSRAEQQLAYHLANGELLQKNQQLSLVQEQFRVAELENELQIKESQQTRLMILMLIMFSCGLLYVSHRLFRRHLFYKYAAENDSLTGISNRFHFEAQLAKQLKHCQQSQKSIGLIMFDLDYFKQINDKFGHEVGDNTLKAVVDVCSHFVRSEDIFGRIGGEEFAIALPDCQPDKVMMLAEICRDAIAQLPGESIAPGLEITASFGVSFNQVSGYNLAELLRNADQALYHAKKNGRNKVECYGSNNPEPFSFAHSFRFPAGNGTES